MVSLQYAIHCSALHSRLVADTPKHTAKGGVFQVPNHLWDDHQEIGLDPAPEGLNGAFVLQLRFQELQYTLGRIAALGITSKAASNLARIISRGQ
jgi:hypothetical protein